MDKEKIKTHAKNILRDIDNYEWRIDFWVDGLVYEVKHEPKTIDDLFRALRIKIEELEEKK